MSPRKAIGKNLSRVVCKHCGSDRVHKSGLSRGRQRYLCTKCQRTFTVDRDIKVMTAKECTETAESVGVPLDANLDGHTPATTMPVAASSTKVNLKRKKPDIVDEPEPDKPKPVAEDIGAKALDLAFNPTRDKLPEVTIIDKFQGRLFPLITVINLMWDYCLQVAFYRQDKDEYRRVFKHAKPASVNWLGELLHSTAQWQKSIGGTNLTKITDIALAEMETKVGEEGEGIGGVDAWGKD